MLRITRAKAGQAHLNSLVADAAIGVDDVTARVGNSIPSTMVDALAQVITSRISAHQGLSAARKKGDYVWMALPTQLHCTSVVATVLLIVTSNAPFRFLLMSGSRMPGALQPSTSEQSLSMATRWATQLGAISAPDVCFPLHKLSGNSTIRAVICPQLATFNSAANPAQDGASHMHAAWTPLESAAH